MSQIKVDFHFLAGLLTVFDVKTITAANLNFVKILIQLKAFATAALI